MALPIDNPLDEFDIEQAYLDIQNRGDDTPNIDINAAKKRAEELSGLYPSSRRSNIYDLASDLSAGLAAQAASGQPASIGYGLATGFKLFNDGEKARRDKVEKMKQALVLKAYTELEGKRKANVDFQKLAATKALEAKIKATEDGGDYFSGTGLENQARNYITKAQILASNGDRSMIYDANGNLLPMYSQSKDVIAAPKTSYQKSGSEIIPVTTTSTIDFSQYEYSIPPQQAIEELKNNPALKSAFIEKYGKNALPEGV